MNIEEPDIDSNNKLGKADFNEAMLQLKRLHDSWTECNKHRRNKDLEKLRDELEIIEDELTPVMLKLAPDLDKDLKEVNKLVKEVLTLLSKTDIRTPNYRLVKKGLYESLRLKYTTLKKIQLESGMGLKFSTADDDEIDE